MPVPTWDCPDLSMIEGAPLDTTTVVSEDIWKKFDLDFPDSFTAEQYYGGVIEDGVLPDPYRCSPSAPASLSLSLSLSLSSSLSRLEAREIRHHDCMWAGLCISKEHNRTLPAKKDLQTVGGGNCHGTGVGNNGIAINGTAGGGGGGGGGSKKSVPAGRSLLINRKPLAVCAANNNTAKNLESDGDLTRPETPQSSESETESEDEPPRFKHDSISINEKLSEYLGDATAAGAASVPVSEVTGQLVRRTIVANSDKKFPRRLLTTSDRRLTENDQVSPVKNGSRNDVTSKKEKYNDRYENDDYADDKNESSFNRKNNNGVNCIGANQPISSSAISKGSIVSLGDHCYHLNQTSSSKKIDYLGIQTPSDSEEEIDVVTFDKPCRPASLPTNPSAADKQHLQNTVTSALKDNKLPPRPRGRPPSNTPRKRSAQTEPKPAKRQKHKTYQKRGRPGESGGSGGGSQGSRRSGSVVDKGSIEPSNVSSVRSQEPISSNGNGNCRFIDSGVETPPQTRLGGIGIGVGVGVGVGVGAGVGSTNDCNVNNSVRINQERTSSKTSTSSPSSATISRSSSDDEPDTEKRSLHNNMERQRRIELRNAFEELRVLVPEVEMKEKAPKVVILRQAAVYCDMLTEMGQATLAEVMAHKRRQDRLRTRLSQLRRSIAATR